MVNFVYIIELNWTDIVLDDISISLLQAWLLPRSSIVHPFGCYSFAWILTIATTITITTTCLFFWDCGCCNWQWRFYIYLCSVTCCISLNNFFTLDVIFLILYVIVATSIVYLSELVWSTHVITYAHLCVCCSSLVPYLDGFIDTCGYEMWHVLLTTIWY